MNLSCLRSRIFEAPFCLGSIRTAWKLLLTVRHRILDTRNFLVLCGCFCYSSTLNLLGGLIASASFLVGVTFGQNSLDRLGLSLANPASLAFSLRRLSSSYAWPTTQTQKQQYLFLFSSDKKLPKLVQPYMLHTCKKRYKWLFYRQFMTSLLKKFTFFNGFDSFDQRFWLDNSAGN